MPVARDTSAMFSNELTRAASSDSRRGMSCRPSMLA